MAYPTHPSRESDAEGSEPAGPVSRRAADPPILGPLPSSSREGAAEEGQRFRRSERPAPSPGESRAVGSEDPFTGSMDVALAAPSGPGRAIAEPLAALAAAFQANAEALRRSQEMQSELGRALQRADRSEVLLQSTGALNDTFKGLTNVQKSLLTKIDHSEKEARNGRWFLPILVLASLAVVGAGLWLVVRRMQEIEHDVVGNADVGTQVSSAYDRGVDQGRKDGGTAFDAERAALQDRLKRQDDDLKTAIAERDAKAASLATTQEELAGLRGEVMTARADALRTKALEDELGRLRAESAVRDPEIERLRRELSTEKSTSGDLRQKLAAIGMGRVPTPDTPGMESASSPPAEAADDPAGPDRRVLEKARMRVNELLQSASAGRADYLQLMRIGGVSGSRLTEVEATRYRSNGQVLNFIKARDARVVVDRTKRTVEFVFSDGQILLGGNGVPFPGGTFTTIVAEGDAISAWTGSGLVFVTTK